MLAGRDAIIRVDGDVCVGTITLQTANYIIIQAVKLKTSTPIGSKFYKNDLEFIKPLKQSQVSREETCDLTLQELQQISKMLSSYIFIERFDRTYHDAIADIESESFIGFYMPGVDRGRFSENSLIVCSTSKAIYIFDIVAMGRIEKAMINILEANAPKKIIHDSCAVADYLKFKQNINLSGVFDTIVAHSSLGFDSERIGLGQCLHDHFQLPENILDASCEWHRRPLQTNQKNVAAQHVVFLKKLHSQFTRMMLKTVYEMFENK